MTRKKITARVYNLPADAGFYVVVENYLAIHFSERSKLEIEKCIEEVSLIVAKGKEYCESCELNDYSNFIDYFRCFGVGGLGKTIFL